MKPNGIIKKKVSGQFSSALELQLSASIYPNGTVGKNRSLPPSPENPFYVWKGRSVMASQRQVEPESQAFAVCSVLLLNWTRSPCLMFSPLALPIDPHSDPHSDPHKDHHKDPHNDLAQSPRLFHLSIFPSQLKPVPSKSVANVDK